MAHLNEVWAPGSLSVNAQASRGWGKAGVKVRNSLDRRGELVAAGVARQRHELVGVDGVSR